MHVLTYTLPYAGSSATASGLGTWRDYVGYCERVLKRRVRAHHCEGDQAGVSLTVSPFACSSLTAILDSLTFLAIVSLCSQSATSSSRTTSAHSLASTVMRRTRGTMFVRQTYTPHQSQVPHQVNQSGLSRAAIFNQVEASLGRLNTDYIDLLQIHRGDLDNVSAEV
jgi:hypothetical protein